MNSAALTSHVQIVAGQWVTGNDWSVMVAGQWVTGSDWSIMVAGQWVTGNDWYGIACIACKSLLLLLSLLLRNW